MAISIDQCLATYAVLVVPPMIHTGPRRTWLQRLLWNPWQAFEQVKIEQIPNGAIVFDHQSKALLMNASTAKRFLEDRNNATGGKFNA